MDIKASDVKALRERTGAGMMDCKRALTEAGGDFERAERLLKELGLAAAAKREGRPTNDGRVFTSVQPGCAAILELSCETDFVARNADFVALGNSIVTDMATRKIEAGEPEFAGRVQEAVATIKENITIRRGALVSCGEGELVTQYVHGDSGRIGVLVKTRVGGGALPENPEIRTFAFDLALHVAAFRPLFLSAQSADPKYLAEQEEIFLAQAKLIDKPAEVQQGIAKGKLKKHLAEVCLLEQGFVRDEKKTVAAALKDLERQVGGGVEVAGYLYYMVGEGS